jgi:hypothetical protein
MSETLSRERIEAEGIQLIDRVKQLIHKGNVSRVVVKQGEQTVAEFPLTAGVVGVVLAPVLAAIGVMAALLTHCTIEVERVTVEAPASAELEAVAAAHPRD